MLRHLHKALKPALFQSINQPRNPSLLLLTKHIRRSLSIKLDASAFETYQIDAPSLDVQIEKEQLIKIYSEMVFTRRMEMQADNLYKSKLIRGFCHLCTGQEAVSSGMEAAITKDDVIITAYRCHGFTYARSGKTKHIFSELLGKESGISKGKGGSMHMFAKSFYGGNGIVGAQVPVGAGIAFAQKYNNKPNCTFALYGDGAANQGQVFEAFNMAKLWDLPCVFVCENNKYGMGTSVKRSTAIEHQYTRGQFIPGILVDGMDVLAVYQATKYAKEYSIQKGPILLEFLTYRYGGHSMSDPGTTYRTREEIQHMRSSKDSITKLKEYILENNLVQEEELKKIDKDARKNATDEANSAKNDKEPNPKELWTDIYATGSEPEYLRGRVLEENHYYKK